MVPVIRRLAAGLSLSMAIVLVTIAAQLAAVPVLLSHWGAQMYGEWLVLTNVVASLSILNLGIQSYASNRLILSYRQRDIEGGTRLLHSSLRTYSVLCAVALAITVAVAVAPGMPARLRIVEIPTLHARIIVILQGVLATYALAGGLLMSIFRVVGRLPRQLTYSLFERIAALWLPVSVAILGGYPLQATIACVAALAVIAAISLREVRKSSPYPFGFARGSWRDAPTLATSGLVFFLVSLAPTLLTSGMTFVLTSALGAVAVVVFSTTLTLTNGCRIAINQGLNVLWPEITAVSADPDGSARLAKWYQLLVKFGCTFACVAVIQLVGFGSIVLSVWTRGRMSPDPLLNLLLALYFAVQVPAMLAAAFGLAANRQVDVSKAQMVFAMLALVLAGGLVRAIGVTGAAWALCLAQLVNTIWMVHLMSRWTGVPLGDLWRDGFRRGLSAVAIMAVATMLIGEVPAFGPRALVSGGMTIALLLSAWFHWLTMEERALSALKLRELFGYSDQLAVIRVRP